MLAAAAVVTRTHEDRSVLAEKGCAAVIERLHRPWRRSRWMPAGAVVSLLGFLIFIPACLLAVFMSAVSIYLLISGKNVSSNGIMTAADVRMPIEVAVAMVAAMLLGYVLIRFGRYLGER